MALSKSISVNGSGVNATYWRLVGVNVDLLANIATIVLAGYKDAQARTDGLNPITTRTVRWAGAANPVTAAAMMAGTAFSAAYTKLTQAETDPLAPPNPFTGGTSV